MFKVVSLIFSLLVFLLTTTWTTPEIFNLLISVLFSMYCIWCIWSLHEALMLGGDAAAKAGFTVEEVRTNYVAVCKTYKTTKKLETKDLVEAISFQYLSQSPGRAIPLNAILVECPSPRS